MKRVSIIGCCGAGKSTFARELQRITGLPLVHLDREYWNAGWKESEKEYFLARTRDIYQKPAWIIDGHYFSTMDGRLSRADTVLYLDYPTRICLGRVLSRTISNHGRDRQDCADNCPERFDLEFIRYIMTFRRKLRQQTLALIDRHQHLTVHIIKHPRDLAGFLDSRTPDATDGPAA